MTEQFRIQQALFGYRDGHHLLSTSVELNPRVRQFLANVTDSSGSENPRGFEVAFTGIPVPETKFYALFCTWPAPEMPRPGCVWSHALLLDFEALANIPDLSILQDLCRRPANPPDLSSYEVTLLAQESINTGNIGSGGDKLRAESLLSAFFEHSESCIVILDEQSYPWEKIVFTLWSQQWPRLRQRFAFSTGSLGDRRTAGMDFDLQIAPLSSKRLWKRGGSPTVLLEFPTKVHSNPWWVRTIIEDLEAGSDGLLRKFLRSYADEIEATREAFIKLIKIFAGPELGEEDDPGSRLAQLASAFPKPDEALRLKHDQLAALSEQTESPDRGHSWAAVYFLLHAKEAVAFNEISFDFDLHAKFFWEHKRADVLSLLGRVSETKRATDFVDTLASRLTPKDIPAIWHEQPEAVLNILARKPGLATSPQAWNLPVAGQQDIWGKLRATTDDKQIWALICGAMLSVECSFNERQTVELAGHQLTDGLQKWLKSEYFTLPSPAWREALRAPLTLVVKEKIMSASLLALAIWVVPLKLTKLLDGHRRDIQELAKQGIKEVPRPLLLPTLFWLTSIGLETPGEDGFALLSRAFFPVYDAVALSKYPGEAWDRLAPVLPQHPFGLDWDRCRRLRRGLRGWLRQNPGFADGMSNAAPNSKYALLVKKLL